jgi:hypothetical protein
MSNPLERTGLDLNELAVLNAALMNTRQKNDKICICGHGSGRHTWTEELQEHNCRPPKADCDCKNLVEVIKSTDTRPFVRKTSGNGNRHALILGMQSALEKGATVEWIVPSVCARCHEEGPTAPCVVSPEGIIYDGIPERRDKEAKKKIIHKLLCQGCREGTKELR